MGTENVKLTANTSGAQQAMGSLKTSWINAAAGMAVVEKAFNMVAGAVGGVNQKMRDQAKLFSAVKDDMQLAAVQMAMAASDGMIKPMTLARGANVLMRGDLKLTQEQMNTVAKAAVELGRATGEDVNQVFQNFSNALNTGATRSLGAYGIAIDEAGSKAEKKKAIIERLTAQYGGLSIAASDAAEVQDKAANEMELQTNIIAKQADGLSQLWTKYKDFYTSEFLAGGVDVLFGTSLARGKQLEELFALLGKQARSLEIDFLMSAARTTNAQQNLQLDLLLHNQEEIVKSAEAYAKSRNAELATLEKSIDLDKRRLSMASQLGISMDDVFATNSRLQAAEARRVELNQIITAEMERANGLAAGLAEIYETRLKSAVQGVADALKTFGIGYTSAADLAAAAKAAEAERKRREAARAASAAEWQKDKEAERAAIADFYSDRTLAKIKAIDDEIRRERDIRDQGIRDAQAADLAYEENKARQRKAIDEARGEIIMRNAEKESEIRKKALDKDLEDRKRYVAKTKELVEGLATVSINAIFAEKKARDGLSKTEYMMKQLKVYMKGEALKYLAKSIGYAAEGTAAIFWNPPAAAAAFKASALSLAAAAAFGSGSAAAGAMGGNNKPSSASGSGSSSKTPDREAVGGATATPANVTINIMGRGVLFGTRDDLMRDIHAGMQSAGKRGVIGA